MFASGWLANVLAAARVALMAWGTTIAMPHAAGAIEFEKVALPGRAGDVALDGYLARPAGLATERKVPAVVGLHGCGGLLNAKGQMRPRERDWAERWTKAGYAVLLVDSFNPRGVSSVCATPFDQRTVKTGLRSHDAGWAAAWLVRQPFIDPARLALVGWSHGGSTALLVARSRTRSEANWARYRHIIAFYPGCSSAANRAASGRYDLVRPVTILIGDADDWTPPEHCHRLVAARPSIKLVTFPGAVHGFDSPNSKRRTRRDTAYAGQAGVQVGTDPKARAAAIEIITKLLATTFAKP